MMKRLLMRAALLRAASTAVAVMVVLLVVAVTGALPAGSAPGPTSGPVFPPPGPHRKIVFGQPVAPPNVVHSPIELAKALGFTDKFNIDLEIKDFEGSTRALTAALTGGVNVGTLDCLTAFGNGVPFVGFYGPAPKLPVVVVARDSIKTLKDLKGKRLGLAGAPGGFIDRMNRAVLVAAGLRPEDVTLVQTTTAGRVAALVTGQADTAIFHYEQASQILRQQKGFHVLYDVQQALPSYQYHVYCAPRAFVQANRGTIVDLVTATILAVRYAYANRAETVRILSKVTGADPEDVGYAYAKIVTGCVWARNLGLDRARLNWTIGFEHQGGDLRNVYDVGQLLDTGIANEALQKAGGPVPVPRGCQ